MAKTVEKREFKRASEELPPLSEERRKILFPNSPPPNFKQLKEIAKNKHEQSKHKK